MYFLAYATSLVWKIWEFFYRDEYNINCSNYTFLEQLPNLHILIKVTLLQWSKERQLADARKIIYKMQLYPGIKRKLPLEMKVVL